MHERTNIQLNATDRNELEGGGQPQQPAKARLASKDCASDGEADGSALHARQHSRTEKNSLRLSLPDESRGQRRDSAKYDERGGSSQAPRLVIRFELGDLFRARSVEHGEGGAAYREQRSRGSLTLADPPCWSAYLSQRRTGRLSGTTLPVDHFFRRRQS